MIEVSVFAYCAIGSTRAALTASSQNLLAIDADYRVRLTVEAIVTRLLVSNKPRNNEN